jgi:hypothetical protein
MNIIALIESSSRVTAVEALYYSLRALKQAGLPEISKKDYFSDTESSTPTPEGVALAKIILSSIENAEQVDIDHIEPVKISSYISDVARAMDSLSIRVKDFSVERGAELLEKMRNL